MWIDQIKGPFVSFHPHVSSDCIKWQHLKILTSRGCKPISAVKLLLRRWAGVRNIITQGPTQSFQFIKFFFFHRGVRTVDIEVYHLIHVGGGMYVAQFPQQRKQETEIEVQVWRPIFILISRLVGSVGYEHSINKTKWQLLALAEAVRLWAEWREKKCTEREFGKSRFY